MTGQPLEGLRVVDVSQYAAGPIAALLLGDYGADVVKVEPLAGDPFRPTRAASIAGTNPAFVSLNRNKRSVAIDLRNPEGQAIVRRLAADADVFVENFKSGVADRLNIGYERLRRRNRGLVYCSVSGFGSEGPYRERPSVDVIAQAVSGMMDQTGDPDGEPMLVGTPLADYMGGIFGSFGVLLALVGRAGRGRGEHVEVSLVDGMLFSLGVRFADAFATGTNPRRRGSGHTQTAPGGAFRARDGRFTVAVLSQDQWAEFCGALGRPDLAADPRFATNVQRVRNRAELIRVLDGVFEAADRAHWLERIAARGISCGPVNSLLDVLADPALSGIVQRTSYAGVAEVPVIGPPVKLGRVRTGVRRPPPVLGADTREVLLAAGYAEARIRRLAVAGVIGLGGLANSV